MLLTLHVITFLLFLINFYFKLLRFSAKGGKRFFRPIWRTCRHLEFWQFYANLVVHFHCEPECACEVVSRTTVPSSQVLHKSWRVSWRFMSFTAFKYHKFSALFCGFLNYPLSMSSDTISVMRHNNSCGKTLLDNWVEEVSCVTWAMF